MSKMNTLIMDRKFIRWNEHKIIMTQMNNYMVCIFSVRTMCIIYNYRDYIYTCKEICSVRLAYHRIYGYIPQKNISTWLAGHPRLYL